MSSPFADVPRLTEALILGTVILLLFGGSKLPSLIRGLHEGMREFHRGLCQIDDDVRFPWQNEARRVRVDGGYVILIALVVVGLLVLLALSAQR